MTAAPASSPFRAFLRLTAFFILSLVVIPVQFLLLTFKREPGATLVPLWFHTCICRLFHIHIKIRGTDSEDTQTVFVANHLSYLDIVVLGSLVKGSFIAKADVADWPFFGLLAKLQRTLFISRQKTSAKDGQREFRNRLSQDGNLILFAEGTSSDGTQILPFKSSLFHVFLDPEIKKITIQPVTISLLGIDSRKTTQASDIIRDFYCWYGDMTLPPHLWHFAGLKSTTIGITFHAPIERADFKDRKSLALLCERSVRAGLEETFAS